MVKLVPLSGRMPPLAGDFAPFTHVLCFDATLAGHRAALSWRAQNPTATAGRVVVPYCGRCGDYLKHRTGCDAEPMPRFLDYHRGYEFKLEPADFAHVAAVAERMEYDVLARDPLTGLSQLQAFLAAAAGDPTEAQALASVRFHVPLGQVREQWFLLDRLNTTHKRVLDPDVYPLALLGAYPIDLESFRTLLKEYFNIAPHRRWGSLPPFRTGFRFEKRGDSWVSHCVRNEAGDITGLPYGVSHAQFAAANPGCDLTDWTLRFAAASANLLEVPVTWDLKFRDREFADPNEYMDWWIAEKLKFYSVQLCDLEQAARKELFRRKFIQSINLATEILDDYGDMVPTYVGEEPHAKRRRLQNDYGNFQDFANIPVGEIGEDEGAVLDLARLPSSGKDIWLAKLL